MRVDKFLKNSRIIKRRSVAKEACDNGRVSINGKVAKAGSEVSVEDTIEIQFGNKNIKVQVLQINESSKKDDAAEMYQVIE